jgi:hypothetical protein
MMCSSTRNRQIISENKNDIIYVGFELTAVVALAVVMALATYSSGTWSFVPGAPPECSSSKSAHFFIHKSSHHGV